jgi:hypothetical protein
MNPSLVKETIMQTTPWSRRLALAAVLALGASGSHAASHREAPAMTLDPAADISDVYAFVSYDAANLARSPEQRKVTLVMNVVPGQEPSAGPNYFGFGDDVLYRLHVDNDRDGVAEDVVYEIVFQTETTNPNQFLATLGGGPLPPVSALEGSGSEGLARKQRYTVTERRGCDTKRKGLKCDADVTLFGGTLLPSVPSNIGPRTMPDYEALAAQGVFEDGATGIRVFAGQRAETFAIDLGAVFDTVNLRVEDATPIPGVRPPLPVMTAAEDADDFQNPYGVNAFSGFNVNTIAIEVPITRLTANQAPATAATGVLGVYASTARRMVTTISGAPVVDEGKPLVQTRRAFRQVSRMGNPLVNELIIPIGRKDFWNSSEPEDEAQFLGAFRSLAVASALEAVSGVPVPPAPREDVVQLLLKYPGQDPDPSVGPFAELLRLDVTVPPTPPSDIKRLTILAHDAAGNSTPDPAGFPNGRRPNDDVTDLVVRVAGGPNFIDNFVGDGVGVAEAGITPVFPFLPTPFDGRNRRHVDPGE